MAKEITKQVEERENKMIASGIDREFFRLYCEDKDELRKSMEDLITLRDTTEDDRIRVDINKYIISQLIGNPKQATEIEAGSSIEIIVNSRTLNEEGNDKS